jgi:hypothetical protein
VLGATNGNFFHRLPGGTFRSNGMIWTATDAPDGAPLAPIEPTVDKDFRGDHVFVADATGGHEVRIASGPCAPGACRVTVSPLPGTPAAAWDVLRARPQPMDDAEFVAALRAAFPGLTLAMQLNHALSDAAGDRAAAPEQVLAEAFRCGPAHAWTCQPHAVTLLCAHPDGAVSLMTSEPASYADLAAGLRVGGACATECALLYLLDGGGSAQIGYADPAGGAFRVTYAGKHDAAPPPGCAEYRPVEHYLVVGTGAAARDR